MMWFMFRLAAILGLALLAPMQNSVAKEGSMIQHAHGAFTVDMKPVTPAPAEGLARFSMNKQIHGDLEGVSAGEMVSGGDYSKGSAGYVAIEMVTGTLAGKHGSFALMQMATMDADGPQMTIKVVPGSGTGELAGIAGTFTIDVSGGKHAWTLDYTLP